MQKPNWLNHIIAALHIFIRYHVMSCCVQRARTNVSVFCAIWWGCFPIFPWDQRERWMCLCDIKDRFWWEVLKHRVFPQFPILCLHASFTVSCIEEQLGLVAVVLILLVTNRLPVRSLEWQDESGQWSERAALPPLSLPLLRCPSERHLAHKSSGADVQWQTDKIVWVVFGQHPDQNVGN